MRLLISTSVAAALLAGCAEAGETAAEPAQIATAQATCQEAEYRQMDFWVGDWALSWDNGDETTGSGTNVITRSPFGDCVVTENFDGVAANGLAGLSVSTYSKPHKLWRQTWVDNQGSYFSLYGGPKDDGTFILEMERLSDKGPYSRMVFEDIKAGSLVWRWQGKKAETDDWADQWVINYVRK